MYTLTGAPLTHNVTFITIIKMAVDLKGYHSQAGTTVIVKNIKSFRRLVKIESVEENETFYTAIIVKETLDGNYFH